ncbi:MAG: HNH endonuclease [Kofleriaceae bacterium]|nr:MAG: HNH endonuclease [Kofleriaceae bacterium]MBZ0234544.1 HNH endonuclease [Kofleriaceae bacterium]
MRGDIFAVLRHPSRFSLDAHRACTRHVTEDRRQIFVQTRPPRVCRTDATSTRNFASAPLIVALRARHETELRRGNGGEREGGSMGDRPRALRRRRARPRGRHRGAASQRWTIAPRIRKAVLARDRHRCTVTGCTSSSFVDVHHIRHREHGGDDRMSNLTTLCELHHAQHHEGVIIIAGVGGAIRVTHADGRPYGAPPPAVLTKPDNPTRARDGDARQALVKLGFRPAEAAALVTKAAAHVGGDASLEQLIVARAARSRSRQGVTALRFASLRRLTPRHRRAAARA